MKDEPIFNPHDIMLYLAKARKVPPEDLYIPKRLLITYTPREYESGKALLQSKKIEWWPYEGRLEVGRFNGREIAVAQLFVGAPGAVMMLEELIAHGAKRIIEAGLSGGIDTSLQPGDLCVITEAFSDEGTSQHYYPRRRAFEPSSELTSILTEVCRESQTAIKTSSVWTTDGVYRETRSKVKKFQSKGATLVNMETSSIFAIAKFRKVDVASIQVVSDILLKDGWKPAFRADRVLESRQAMLRSANKALARA